MYVKIYMESCSLDEEVYYESIKREPKIRGINKCRCDERLQTRMLQKKKASLFAAELKKRREPRVTVVTLKL
jgi:hypothetical protein